MILIKMLKSKKYNTHFIVIYDMRVQTSTVKRSLFAFKFEKKLFKYFLRKKFSISLKSIENSSLNIIKKGPIVSINIWRYIYFFKK
jgi:hypothetical protein